MTDPQLEAGRTQRVDPTTGSGPRSGRAQCSSSSARDEMLVRSQLTLPSDGALRRPVALRTFAARTATTACGISGYQEAERVESPSHLPCMAPSKYG
jgi:hypothetical protein